MLKKAILLSTALCCWSSSLVAKDLCVVDLPDNKNQQTPSLRFWVLEDPYRLVTAARGQHHFPPFPQTLFDS